MNAIDNKTDGADRPPVTVNYKISYKHHQQAKAAASLLGQGLYDYLTHVLAHGLQVPELNPLIQRKGS